MLNLEAIVVKMLGRVIYELLCAQSHTWIIIDFSTCERISKITRKSCGLSRFEKNGKNERIMKEEGKACFSSTFNRSYSVNRTEFLHLQKTRVLTFSYPSLCIKVNCPINLSNLVEGLETWYYSDLKKLNFFSVSVTSERNI